MKQQVSPVLIGVIVAVVVLVLGFFVFKTFGPGPSSGGKSPYENKGDLKNLKPGENPNGGYGNPGGGGTGRPGGAPQGSSGGPPQ